jgi:TolB-like protein
VSTQRIAEFAGYRLDYAERALQTPQGAREQLSRRLFETLALLLERAGQLVTKEELMHHVWADVVVEENTLTRTVSSLRQKLGGPSGDDRFIATVSGAGYRFVKAVEFGTKSRAATGGPHTVAVLPLEDFSAAQDQRYFADGLADELISALAALPELRVTARTSSFQLRSTGARAAGQRLGVACVVTGAVRTEGERLRVSVQLVDARSEQQLWAAQRDGLASALFALQEEVSRAVRDGLAQALHIRAVPQPPQRVPDPRAYDLLLRARAAAQQSGGPALKQTYALLKQAVALDPDFAQAWVTLAVYARTLLIFGVPVTDEVFHDIENAAERTLQLEPDQWTAQLASASRHHLHRDWLAMEQALNRARELAHGMPGELNVVIGHMHNLLGRVRSAARHWRELTASDPLSLISSGICQVAMHMSGDEAGAQLEYQRSLGLQGDRDMVEHLSIHRRWAQGLPFHEQLRRYLEHQSTELPVIRAMEPVQDQPQRAVPLLMDALPQQIYAPPARQLMLGWWLARYGEDETVMRILWNVYVERGHTHTAWLWFPVLAHVRKMTRFQDLLERVGLTHYWQQSGTRPEPPAMP